MNTPLKLLGLGDRRPRLLEVAVTMFSLKETTIFSPPEWETIDTFLRRRKEHTHGARPLPSGRPRATWCNCAVVIAVATIRYQATPS